MPLTDTTRSRTYHDNYTQDGTRLYYNHLLGLPRPVGTPQIPIHYCRFAQQFIAAGRAQRLVDVLPLIDGQSILIIGAGFGWMSEKLKGLLPSSNIVSIETSAWINSNLDKDEIAELTAWVDAAGVQEPDRTVWINRFADGVRSKVSVMNESMQSAESRNRILQRIIGQKFHWGITEHVLEWLTDAECTALSTRCRLLCNTVCHAVTPFDPEQVEETEPNGNWNWKWLNSDAQTTAELQSNAWYTTTNWSALLPTDTFVRA